MMEKEGEKMQQPEHYVTIQKSQLTRCKTTKDRALVEKMCLLNCKNDLKGLNYNKYGKKGHTIYPISKVFCDNFLLTAPSDRDEKKKNILVGLYNQRIHTVLVKHNQKAFIKAVGYNEDDRQRYKISCNSVPLDAVIAILEDEELLQNDILLDDIDITQDFAGCFDKEEVSNAMSDIGFHMQGDPYYGEEEGTVIDNSRLVGDNCLTFCDREGRIRSKIYNKFAQEIESDSVRDNFGHHLYSWCHAGGIYKDIVKGALKHGLLRVETTYYGRVPTQEEMDDSIERWKQILKPNLCYSTPIEKQWLCVTERINRNLVIKCGNLIAVCHWINSLTGKIGGCLKETEDPRDFYWMATELTFNKPLDVIYMDVAGKEIRLGVNTYTKICSVDNTAAQLVGRKFLYQTGTADPSQFGLVRNNGVEFYVRRNKCSKRTRPRFALTLEEPVDIVCMDKRLVVNEEITKLKEQKEKTKVRESQNQDREDVKSIIKVVSTAQSLIHCKKGDVIEVCDAMQRNTRYGLRYIIVGSKGTTYWADASTNSFLSKLKPTAIHNGYDVICNKFILKILGHGYTNSKNKYVKTEISNVEENVEEELVELTPIPLPKKEGNLGKPKDYNKLDNLVEGTVLDVKEYGILTVRGQDRHVIFTDKGAYIDNWFLREIYAPLGELTEHKTVCCGFKTTKQKAKAMSVRII